MVIASGKANAQTVMVRHVPAGEAVDVFLNATKVGTAVVNATGDTKLPLNLRENNAGKTDIDANVFIDVCDKIRKVIVVERGQPAATQEPGCDQREISGLYFVRREHTLVVDLGGVNPTMMLIKGSSRSRSCKALDRFADRAGPLWRGRPRRPPRRGAHLVRQRATCSGDDAGFSFTAGFDVWIKRWVAGTASYFRPPRVTAKGSGSTYSFDSALEPNVLIFGGRLGIPIGPVRITGLIGTTFQDATLTTHETINNASQVFLVETRGWGWTWSGGLRDLDVVLARDLWRSRVWHAQRHVDDWRRGAARRASAPRDGGRTRQDRKAVDSLIASRMSGHPSARCRRPASRRAEWDHIEPAHTRATAE